MNAFESPDDVLNSVISCGTESLLFQKKRIRSSIPDHKSFREFCDIMSKNSGEESIQKFLEHNVGYLTGLFGSNDNSDLAVIFKPQIGNQFRADFCILQAFQGGSLITIIEIEPSNERIFTKKLTPARRYQAAIGQCRDWRDWIYPNKQTFVKDIIRVAKGLPLYNNFIDFESGVRFCDQNTLEEQWRIFGGYDDPVIKFGIIIGRWSKLNSYEKNRLLNTNKHENQFSTYTFEQLARRALFRCELAEF